MCFTSELAAVRQNRAASLLAGVLLGAYGLVTGYLAIRMLWYLFHSWTNVPWRDQWPLLEEIRAFEEHRYGWSYLWTPYWGVRIVIPRLLFLLSAKLFSFSNKPLVLVNVAAQVCGVWLVSYAAWRLLRQRSLGWRLLAVIATANLLLCSLQLENIIWGMGVEFTVGYIAGAAAIVVLERFPSLTGSVFLALISTLSVGAGLLLWPVLAVQAWILGRPKRYAAMFSLAGICLAGCYVVGYVRPDLGTGIGGIIRRPIAALNIAGLILGGPVSLVSRQLSTATGWIGMTAACYIFYRVFRRPRGVASERVVGAMLVLFFLGIVFTIVAGRISPEWLAARQGAPLPSRYFTPAFLFWASLFSMTLAFGLDGGVLARVVSAAVGAIVLAVTLGTLTWQLEAPVSWAWLFRNMDAAASAFFVGASDEEYMSTMYPEATLRSRGVEYLRQKRWSVFAEDRAGWVGKKLHETFSIAPAGECEGGVEGMKLVSQFPALRLTGRLMQNKNCSIDPVEILITDPDDVIIGLGRTLLPTSNILSSGEQRFLAYGRIHQGQNNLYVYTSVRGGRVSLMTKTMYNQP